MNRHKWSHLGRSNGASMSLCANCGIHREKRVMSKDSPFTFKTIYTDFDGNVLSHDKTPPCEEY